MPEIAVVTVAGEPGEPVHLRDDVFGIEPHEGRPAPGSRPSVGGSTPGHGEYQDPRLRARLDAQGLASEGHRPCPAGQPPGAALARWRSGFRAAPAELSPKDAAQDALARVALGTVECGARGAPRSFGRTRFGRRPARAPCGTFSSR